MSKKTGFQKVVGRNAIVREVINRLTLPPFKEVVTYLDFTSPSEIDLSMKREAVNRYRYMKGQ